MTLAELNTVAEDLARERLLACCGSRRWVEAMVAARPFATKAALLGEATRRWASLAEGDWLEAFTHHPRIGDQTLAGAAAATRGWAADEQAGATGAANTVKDALAQANRAYEARFGRVFLVCATGKSAEEMLQICRSRLENDAATELAVAAGEQDKITRLRLEKLLSP